MELAPSHLGPLWLSRDDGGSFAMARRIRLGPKPDQEMVDRLSEAAFTAMEIDHARISRVTEVLLQGSEIGVLQAYVEGVTLRTLQRSAATRRRPVPTGVAIRLFRDLLEGLTALHGYAGELGELASSLFGGVNPDSILVGTEGRLHLLDPLVGGAAARIETIRNHSDRLAYTAPEQNDDKGTVDATSDVFCAGILLWELIAERRLFMGLGKSVAQKVLALKIPRLDELQTRDRPAVSAAVADIAARALERDRSQRFASPSEMLVALDGAGISPAPEDQVAAYVEEIAKFELRRQRDAAAAREPGLSDTPLKHPAGAGERPSSPDIGNVRRVSAPDGAPPRGKRVPKRTLLGLAPPKPHSSSQQRAPDPRGGQRDEYSPNGNDQQDPIPAERTPFPSSLVGDEPLVADTASIARALEGNQRQVGTARPKDLVGAPVLGSLPLGHAPRPPPADVGAVVPTAPDQQAFDAELEAVYEDPMPVRIQNLEPFVAASPNEGLGPSLPGGDATAAPGEIPGSTVQSQTETSEPADLAKQLAPTDAPEPIPEPDEAPPAGQVPELAGQPGTAKNEQSGPATAAIPLIHDHRFVGNGPRRKAPTSFWGGILVGAAVAFLVVLFAAVLVSALSRRKPAPEPASQLPALSTPPMQASASPPPTSTGSSRAVAQPEKRERPEAPDRPDESDNDRPPTESNEPDTTTSSAASPTPAPVSRARPIHKPKPNPKPSFVPDGI